MIDKPKARGWKTLHLTPSIAQISQSEGQVIHVPVNKVFVIPINVHPGQCAIVGSKQQTSDLLICYLSIFWFHPPCHWGAVLGCDGGGGGVHQGVQTELNSWWSWWCCWWRCWWCVRNITWPQGSSGQDDDVTPQLESPSQANICLSSFSPTWALFIGFVFLSKKVAPENMRGRWKSTGAYRMHAKGTWWAAISTWYRCTVHRRRYRYLEAINNMINIHSSISSTFVLKMPSLISLSTLYLTWISQRQEWYREDKGRAELDTTSQVQIWKEKDKICRDFK